ncbi:uncharacterized protein LOC142896913 [Nelusetta ayraudi]|uniref:uncharacterized protein LOC142896913 n=1 Tax=Nelusetta ayraudi TaxID=303726 RepID=UPI003F7180DA
MSGKVIVMFAMLLVLLVSSAASSSPSGEAGDSEALQRLLASRRRAPSIGEPPAPRAPLATRAERRAHLSDEEREIVTKQIMQAISEIMNSDCMADRDYQGWLDFGRRNAE